MTIRELLIETSGFMPPARAVDALTAADAERHVSPTVHSVAEIVAHMTFWQGWFVQRCRGDAAPMARSASIGWPAVEPGSWTAIRERFLRGLDDAAALGFDTARLDAPLAPAIEYPPLAHLTTREALIHIGTHNAHHLGQVITLRQVIGQWPPPEGSWTW